MPLNLQNTTSQFQVKNHAAGCACCGNLRFGHTIAPDVKFVEKLDAPVLAATADTFSLQTKPSDERETSQTTAFAQPQSLDKLSQLAAKTTQQRIALEQVAKNLESGLKQLSS